MAVVEKTKTVANISDEQKVALRDAIATNVNLHSARYNKDHLTIGLEMAKYFPEMVESVIFDDEEAQAEAAQDPTKHYVPLEAKMVSLANVKAAMWYIGDRVVPETQTEENADGK